MRSNPKKPARSMRSDPPGSKSGVASPCELSRSETGDSCVLQELPPCLKHSLEMPEVCRRKSLSGACGSPDDFRLLFDCAPQPMCVYERKTLKLLAVNDAAVRFFGYSRRRFLSMTIPDIEMPESAPVSKGFPCITSRMFSGICVRQFRRKDGSTAAMEILTRSMMFQGTRSRIIIIKDVTRQKQAENRLREARDRLERSVTERAEELRRSEERYRALVEMSPDAIFIQRNWTVVFANPAAAELFGTLRPEELVGKSVFDLFDPQLHPLIRRYASQMEESGGLVPRIGERILRLDGAIRDVEVVASKLVDSDGPAMQVVVHDVTQRREVERRLRESETRYRQLVELCPDAICICHGFEIAFVNEAAVRLFGAEAAEQLIGRSLADLVPPEYLNAVAGRAAQAFKPDAVPSMVEGKILRLDGAARDIEVVSASMETPNGPAVLSVIRDITDRKQLEREILHAVEREQERIGLDLHDGLCQLLVAAKYRVAALERHLQRESRDEAREATGVEQMLNGAIHQARALAHGLNPVKLAGNGLIHALEELAAVTQATRQVRCLCRCGVPAAAPDHNTANHLYRIAQEAVQNALRHGNAKTILITLNDNAGRLQLAVKDNGVGFPYGNGELAGAGLNNMKTRAAMIGARLNIQKRKGGGTAVVCILDYATPES